LFGEMVKAYLAALNKEEMSGSTTPGRDLALSGNPPDLGFGKKGLCSRLLKACQEPGGSGSSPC
jgi:hypothetical protein